MEMNLLTEFTHPSQPGTERRVVDQVVQAVGKRLRGDSLERMKTAVSEAAMNAIEHGNQSRTDVPVRVEVLASEQAVMVRLTDFGTSKAIPETTSPDIDAMLSEEARPRGWGLFLIRNMTDELFIVNGSDFHTIELVFYTESGGNDHKSA